MQVASSSTVLADPSAAMLMVALLNGAGAAAGMVTLMGAAPSMSMYSWPLTVTPLGIASQALKPRGPCAPAGPVAPVAPLGPAGPATPVLDALSLVLTALFRSFSLTVPFLMCLVVTAFLAMSKDVICAAA
ncbi:hypothetical protein [Nocardioides piscis]|uniref:Uncharacterized protein n=1 Tax=Nocardioides piscis TaxID=2714938 RepID=A0A6G7YIK7_9ACTN|nr:hypothetical protein [Nocardioides piscis]QIK76568.1 hypothetical protein G7071_15230 [Nocardioides piscis]